MYEIPHIGDLVRNESGVVFLIVRKSENEIVGKMFEIMLQKSGEIFEISERKLNSNFSKLAPQRAIIS